MTPTPTPVPPVAGSIGYYLNLHGVEIVAAVWAILLLFVLLSMVNVEMRHLLSLIFVAVVTLPVVLVNVAWWAITVYFWVVMLLVFTSFRRLLGRGIK